MRAAPPRGRPGSRPRTRRRPARAEGSIAGEASNRRSRARWPRRCGPCPSRGPSGRPAPGRSPCSSRSSIHGYLFSLVRAVTHVRPPGARRSRPVERRTRNVHRSVRVSVRVCVHVSVCVAARLSVCVAARVSVRVAARAFRPRSRSPFRPRSRSRSRSPVRWRIRARNRSRAAPARQFTVGFACLGRVRPAPTISFACRGSGRPASRIRVACRGSTDGGSGSCSAGLPPQRVWAGTSSPFMRKESAASVASSLMVTP